ncbi:transposase, partial [Shigella boydii 965-58]
MDSARALIARGWGVSLVSRCLRVSRAQLHVILRRTDDWMDGRAVVTLMIRMCSPYT